MAKELNTEFVNSFSNALFNFVWFKNNLTISSIIPRDPVDLEMRDILDVISNAIVCKQNAYRLLYKEFFVSNISKFFESKKLYIQCLIEKCYEIYEFPVGDFFEKFWNICGFIAEMYTFSFLSELEDIDLWEAPHLFKQIFASKFERDLVQKPSWEEMKHKAGDRYSDLYSELKPFIILETKPSAISKICVLRVFVKYPDALRKIGLRPDELIRKLQGIFKSLSSPEHSDTAEFLTQLSSWSITLI